MWKYTSVTDLPEPHTIQAIGLDVETYDPDLIEGGPGWARNWGHLVGISIAILGGKSYYFPLRHEVDSFDNIPREEIDPWLNDVLSKPIPKVGANLIYDIGWLLFSGYNVVGPYYDVQFAEALLTPDSFSFSLDNISNKYLGESKITDELYKWCASKYRGKPDGSQRANIYRAPPALVGPYAEADADLPLRILQKQEPLLEAEGLEELFRLESDLIEVLVNMRLRGVSVDLLRAAEASDELKLTETILREQLYKHAGFSVNVNSSKDLAALFDKAGLAYPTTAKGNPSFTGPWLDSQDSKEASMIKEIRKVNKARISFVENAILEKAINNKIYPSFHPLRSDSGGTVTGRFACSNPNAQQFPSRDEGMASIIRGIFVPENGHTHWLKMDYSQIEYRMFAHFSNDQALIDKYSIPGTDFHELVGSFLGEGIPRKPVKNINFMMLYGGGPSKVLAMLSELNLNIAPQTFMKLYDTNFPAAKELMNRTSRQAKDTGEIRTILNRKTTFDLWAPTKGKAKPMPYNQAYYTYGGGIERANTYKALNYLLQGSAADLIKKGMVDAHKAGLFNKVGYPHLQVHDELCFSYHPDYKRDFIDIIEIMENAIPLKVPVRMDAEIGLNWGNCKEKLQ